MKAFFRKYNIFPISLLVITLGHFLFVLSSFDLKEFIVEKEMLLNKYHLDEWLLWALVILVLTTVNYIITLRRKYIQEKVKIYHSMLYASNHILRNLLNQIQVVRLEAESVSEFDPETLKMFDESVAEAEELVSKLSKIKCIDQKSIYDSLYVD